MTLSIFIKIESVVFALQAKQLFNNNSKKIILDEFDLSMYTNF